MKGSILGLPEGGEPIEMLAEPYGAEADLQRLLAEHPSLLAGDQMDADAPRRWLLVRREMGVPDPETSADRWALDHLFLDQGGIPTLVEVKRATDTRLRREVIGQLLDYAANGLSAWSMEAIQSAFDRRCEEEGLDSREILNEFLDEDTDEEAFWTQVQTNMQAGRIRLVLVADRIPTDTQRIIHFLDTQMNPARIFAVEVLQYVGPGMKTLVTRVVGNAAPRRKTIARPTTEWTDAVFLTQLEHARKELVPIARALLAWGRQETREVRWGSGGTEGNFHVWTKGRGEGSDLKLLSVSTRGHLRVQFFRLVKGGIPLRSVAALIDQLNTIPGVNFADSDVNGMPAIPLRLLEKEQVMRRFQGIMAEAASDPAPGT